MEATTNGTLDKTDVKFCDGAAACVVLASGGYPLAYEKGKEITGLTAGQLDAADVTVYHAGTAIKDGRLVTTRRARAGRDRHGQHPARGAEKGVCCRGEHPILTSCTSAVTLGQERGACSKKAPSWGSCPEGD